MFESLYTQEIRTFIRTRPWPTGLIYEVREADEPAPHLNLIFFVDNWIKLDPADHLIIVGIVKDIVHKLGNEGVPIYVGKVSGSGLAN